MVKTESEILALQPGMAPDRRVEYPWIANRIQKEGRILDIGCGGSPLDKYFKNKGFEVITTDVSDVFGAYYYDREKREDFVLCDCFHPPFRTEAFDYILAISTIEHFMDDTDDSEALKRLVPLLRAYGRMLVTVPYGAMGEGWLYNRGNKIARIYSDDDLQKRLVDDTGLTIIKKDIFYLNWVLDVVCLEFAKK